MDVDDDDIMTNKLIWMQLLHMLRLLWPSQQLIITSPQHAHNINIHKLNQLPETNRLGLCRFSAQWNRLHRNSRVRSIIDFFPISVRIFQNELLVLKNSVAISVTKIGILEPVTLK